MIDLGKINELASKLSDAIPPGANQVREEIEGQFKAVLVKTFEKLDLVTREEFDAQTATLERAMVKLKTLERQLDHLEKDQGLSNLT